MDAEHSLINDWPWLLPWQRCVDLLPTAKPQQGHIALALNGLAEKTGSSIPLRFVFSDEVLGALEYEQRVAEGLIPTRDCWHDWYNGLVWLRFPHSKTLINRLHRQESVQLGAGNGRSSRRNALTLLDEAGAILLCENPQPELALKAFDWQTLLVAGRPHWGVNCRLELFGHGLLESLHKPYKGLCAKVVCMQVDALAPVGDADLDGLLAKRIEELGSPLDLNPLPVMGVPGWFAANEAPGFYDDPQVFREKPTRRQ